MSVSLLRKVEQGSKPASAALLSSVARALRIEQAKLTGQPYFSGDRNLDAIHDLVPELRRELSQYGLPPDDDEPAAPVSLPELGLRVAECSELVHGVDYTRLGVSLPGLLLDLRATSFATSGADRVKVMLLMSETYDNAKRLVYDLGYADLGTVAVSLEERATVESEDPLAVSVASAVRAWMLTGNGAFGAAAADVAVVDHSSLGLYYAMLGRPLVTIPVPPRLVNPIAVLTARRAAAPLVDRPDRLAAALRLAPVLHAAHHDHDRFALARYQRAVTSYPGQAAERTRAVLYRALGLSERWSSASFRG